MDEENKRFHDKVNQQSSTNPALQKALEGKLQPKEVNYTHLYSHYENQYGGSSENWESIYLKTQTHR